MNAPVGSNEQILLVGDGDFSFTLSLTNYLRPSCLVGTNLETEESIQKHKNAQDNIEELLEKGAHLILGVDARQLNIHPQVGEQHFQRIIFNFPHIGGKSNNKKNRALLNDFFKSAAGVLSPEGEVMVTLCRGQGGTPADQPRRLWADSWQIVSMAANSGFILTQVIPFEAEIYPRYSCTGFRSQDKGFHLEGSLTHTFQRRDAIPVPQNVTPLPVILNGKEFLCPTYLHSKISSYRKIMKNPDHPFRLTEDNMISELKKVKTMEILRDDQLPCVMKRSDLSVSSPDLWACRLEFPKSLGEESEESTIVSSIGFESPNDVLQSPDNQPVFKDGIEYYSRTSLIENIPWLLENENLKKQQYLLTRGLTFTQGVISPGFLPVSIELLGLTKCGMDENEVIEEEIHEMLNSSLKTNCSLSSKETQPPVKIKNIFVEFLTKITCKNTTEELCVGYILKILNQNDNDSLFYGFLISIDKLTKIRLSVDHKSILWRENIRQFLNPQSSSATVNEYKPISTYPLEFVHDMSFWENPALAFDENQFSCIVRDVAADCVTSVKLIDTYREPETKRTGRCYRCTYQSFDLCLSYKTSWELQSLIRLVTAEKMGITLR